MLHQYLFVQQLNNNTFIWLRYSANTRTQIMQKSKKYTVANFEDSTISNLKVVKTLQS